MTTSFQQQYGNDTQTTEIVDLIQVEASNLNVKYADVVTLRCFGAETLFIARSYGERDTAVCLSVRLSGSDTCWRCVKTYLLIK